MVTTKLEIEFDRIGNPVEQIQYYRVYRKRGLIPNRLPEEVAFYVVQPTSPENGGDTVLRLDSQTPQTGVAYDPLGLINELDTEGNGFKIGIDVSLPFAPTNVVAVPDPAPANKGGILIVWTAAANPGTVWGYDATAVDAGGLESQAGAILRPGASKLQNVNVGLADGVRKVPSEYPKAGQLFRTYSVSGGPNVLYVDNGISVVDDNAGQGWDLGGPQGATAVGAVVSAGTITLTWDERIKIVGTNQSGLVFLVTAYNVAGYSKSANAISGPNNIVCPITDGIAGVKIVRRDCTYWQDGASFKTVLPPPNGEEVIAPDILPGVFALNHGSVIRGSFVLTNSPIYGAPGTIMFTEDSGTFLSPNGDGDYVVDYSRLNTDTDIGGRIKILSGGSILPGQHVFAYYKYGKNYGTGLGSDRPDQTDITVGPYNGTKWSGNGAQFYDDVGLDQESAYNYAWFIFDNSGRVTEGNKVAYIQSIISDLKVPPPVTGFRVDPVLRT